MASRILPRGLRARLALVISLITVAVVAGSFVAIHERTGLELQRRIDSDLTEQFGEFQKQRLRGVTTPRDLERAAKKFVASQKYHPESRIFVLQVSGEPTVTNQQEVLEDELERESRQRGDPDLEGIPTLVDAPSGLHNVSTDESGNLRVLSRPIYRDMRRLGTFAVADPRLPIERSRAGLRKTFLIVGAIALVVAFVAAVWVATLITRPLRHMARVVTDVDAGDLSHRIGRVGTSDEVRSLAESFDHMLDRLELAFKRQREFVSDASHELRTPLTVLRGQIELLSHADSDWEDRERTIQTLLRELDRMNRLVDDMLVLARAEGGELVQLRPVELSGFLEDLERDLPLLGNRLYEIQGPREGVLEADPDRLSQVFRNLVSNAVGQTKQGDRITVTVSPRESRIQFSVSDTGPGIPRDHMERIFDRFYRTDGGRARDQGGSGLGLPIARAIVQAHGGSITADSQPGGGAMITFEMPGYRPR